MGITFMRNNKTILKKRQNEIGINEYETEPIINLEIKILSLNFKNQ